MYRLDDRDQQSIAYFEINDKQFHLRRDVVAVALIKHGGPGRLKNIVLRRKVDKLSARLAELEQGYGRINVT